VSLSPENQRAREWIAIDDELFQQMLRRVGPELLEEKLKKIPGKLDFGFVTNWDFYQGPDAPVLSLDLNKRQRTWVDARLQSWLGLWRVREVDPSRSVVLHDELSGEQCHVFDVALSQAVRSDEGVFGYFVHCDGIAITGGLDPRILASQHFNRVIDLAQARMPKQPDRKYLASEAASDLLFPLWAEAADYFAQNPLPEFVEELRIYSQSFTFPSSQGAQIREALGAQPGEDTITISGLGTVLVTTLSLILEADSVKQAAALRKTVQAACEKFQLLRGHTEVRITHQPPKDPRNDPEVQKLIAQLQDQLGVG
jgi:hypothetical protein